MVNTPQEASDLSLIHLPNRAVIRISGTEKTSFVQGLITNDIHLLETQSSLYACMLTPQGKFLYEFFIFKDGDDFLFDTEKNRVEECLKRLTMYKLRAKVAIKIEADMQCFATFSQCAASDICIEDPRHTQAGYRCYVASSAKLPAQTLSFETYDAHRIKLGLPDGAQDMEVERSTMAEARMDQINGVSYKKGCYIGQEITARMHHRGLVKKELIPIQSLKDQFPESGENIIIDDKAIGIARSSCQDVGIALIKKEHMPLLNTSSAYKCLI